MLKSHDAIDYRTKVITPTDVAPKLTLMILPSPSIAKMQNCLNDLSSGVRSRLSVLAEPNVGISEPARTVFHTSGK